MEEIAHVPARERALCGTVTMVCVTLPKQLHAYYGKDEDDDGQDERQVAEGTKWIVNDFDQHI